MHCIVVVEDSVYDSTRTTKNMILWATSRKHTFIEPAIFHNCNYRLTE